MKAPTLFTDRLKITSPDIAHFDAYAAAWASPEMTRHIGEPRDRQTSWGKFCQAAGLWELLGYGYFFFLDRKSGRFIGTGGLGRFERDIAGLEDYPEAGWAIAYEEWGKGYVTEAMAAVMNWADSELALPETRCIIDEANFASQKVAAGLGFVLIEQSEGTTGPLGLYARKTRAPA